MSRKHARIFEKDGRYFAEDMGSANGTKVNGEPVKVARELKDGDSLAVGPVVFAFRQAVLDAGDPTAPPSDQSTRIVGIGAASAAPVDDGSTRIKASSAILPPVAKGQSGARKRPELPRSEPEPEAAGELVSDDATLPPRPRPSNGAAPLPVKSTGARAAVRPPSGGGNKALAGVETGPNPVGSAADRLRRRRQYGDTLGGQLAFLWDGLSGKTKTFIILGVVFMMLGTGGGLYMLFRPAEAAIELPPEPASLSRTPVTWSFGYGDDVNYERADQKTFEFEFAAATRAVAVLRYQAANISAQEVTITVNGSPQGTVPADTLDRDREVEQLLAPKDLKKGETNRLVFDNTKNPPGRDTWSIWNISVEVIPIPDGSDEDLTKIASDYAAKGKEYFDNRDIGAENMFRAWKNYRAAWLTLEALQGPKPENYNYVRDQLDMMAKELDAICRRMMLDVHRHLQLKQEPRAAAKLEEVDSYFPTNEHRCHNQAHALRTKLEL